MIVRDATPEDAPKLAWMGHSFFVEAEMPGRGVEFCPDSFLRFCEALSEHGILLVAADDKGPFGMLGAGIVPAFWNASVTLAQECFWYVEPAQRRKKKSPGTLLLKEMERRAAEKGAILGAMVAEHGLRGDAVGQLYRRQGYAPAESTFWKRLAA